MTTAGSVASGGVSAGSGGARCVVLRYVVTRHALLRYLALRYAALRYAVLRYAVVLISSALLAACFERGDSPAAGASKVAPTQQTESHMQGDASQHAESQMQVDASKCVESQMQADASQRLEIHTQGALEGSVNAEDASSDDIKRHELTGATMGTSWRLVWIGPDPASEAVTTPTDDEGGASVLEEGVLSAQTEPGELNLAIENELSRINALMSTWDPESELSRFNQSRSVEPIVLHADTLQVVDTALRIARLTDGRYDITLQPVIDLWGFGKEESTPTPDSASIEQALQQSGHEQLERTGKTIRKRVPSVSLDVSSLAKGYAVDKLGELVESFGISRYLVDIGGELRARGRRADGTAWQVGIENPDGDVRQVIALHDTHIATSGSYRNYRVEAGKRLSHIIDGATGRPIDHSLVAVSVVHESTMLADAWATALLVVGEDRAQELIEQQSLVAKLTTVRDGRFDQVMSPEFAALVSMSRQ